MLFENFSFLRFRIPVQHRQHFGQARHAEQLLAPGTRRRLRAHFPAQRSDAPRLGIVFRDKDHYS